MKLSSILPPSHSSFIKPSLFLHHSNDINGFRGVYPSVDLEKDTIVASYPLTQYYNPSRPHVNEGNPNDDGEDICTTDQQTIQLAEWLLEQCALNNQSKYYTWVNHLPTTLNVFDAKNIMHLLTTTTLTLSSTEEKDLLQENMIRTQIVRGKHLIYNKTTLEQYQWAVSIVLSRSFDDEGVRYLLPGLDFFNHCDDGDEPLNVDVFNGYLIISTMKTYKAGEELCINYSKQQTLPRKDAILQYGF